MKDLGLKIMLCNSEDALALSVRFGHNQALIYLGDGSDSHQTNIARAQKWLDGHPFVLSALDSKGLEFDDVVLMASFGRKVWDVSSQREESLHMLRELYVAVTRAKRRVVILIAKAIPL